MCSSDLDLVTRAERLPELNDSYGREVWRRVSQNLPRKTPRAWPAFFAPRRLAFAGVFALVLVATFLAGRFWKVVPFVYDITLTASGLRDPLDTGAATQTLSSLGLLTGTLSLGYAEGALPSFALLEAGRASCRERVSRCV